MSSIVLFFSFFLQFFVSAQPLPKVFVAMAVTDNDHQARDPEKFLWRSTFQKILISFDPIKDSYELELGEKGHFETDHSRKNRSMEFSAIQTYLGKTYGFCDYTGFMYELTSGIRKAKPILFLPSGNGEITLPFKCEWVTIYKDKLLVGSIGKEWVVDGIDLHQHCEWVKLISFQDGSWKVEHLNWHDRYMKIREFLGYMPPGYIVHEAIIWDPEFKLWIILPRKLSKTLYDERVDQHQGGNTLLITDEEFKNFQKFELGPFEADWGFSAMIKLQQDHYLGIKASEMTNAAETTCIRDITNDDGFEFTTASKAVVFNLKGEILSNWLFLGPEKFEGVDLIEEK